MVSGHFGNFELGSYITGLLGYRGYVIARPLDNPYLDRYVSRFRAAYGQIVLPKHGSAGQVEAVLSGGGRIGLLGDQHAGPKGCWVDFLGRPASCHKAVALLTLTGGAPLLVTYAKRVGGPLQFEAGLMGVADPQTPGQEQANVESLTRWYNAMLEAGDPRRAGTVLVGASTLEGRVSAQAGRARRHNLRRRRGADDPQAGFPPPCRTAKRLEGLLTTRAGGPKMVAMSSRSIAALPPARRNSRPL